MTFEHFAHHYGIPLATFAGFALGAFLIWHPTPSAMTGADYLGQVWTAMHHHIEAMRDVAHAIDPSR